MDNQDSSSFEEKVIDEKKIYEGAIIDLVLETVVLPNGQTAKREIVHHNGAVEIMPLLPDGRMLFVKQWRAPMRKITIEIPAGKIDKGEIDPLKAATRELNEETGMHPSKMELIDTAYSSPGYSDELDYLYLATGLTKLAHKRPLDEDEFLNVHALTLDEAKQEKKRGTICDEKTIKTLYLWELLQLKGQLNG